MHVYFLKRDKYLKNIVNSKSKTSEEIQLNPYLKEHGIPVRATDLGVWIVQLAEQTPPVWLRSAPMVCVGCVIQIGGGLDKQNLDIGAMQTAEILAKSFKKNICGEG